MGAMRTFRPIFALAKSIDFTDDMMNVQLMDGRVIGVPIAWFPRLLAATPKQRKKYEIGGGGIGLHWPALAGVGRGFVDRGIAGGGGSGVQVRLHALSLLDSHAGGGTGVTRKDASFCLLM